MHKEVSEIFFGLLVLFIVLCGARCYFESQQIHARSSDSSVTRSPEFDSFQLDYFLVYLLAIGAYWLQRPYDYALYTAYGYGKKEIGQLLIASFASSAVFGTFIGSLADKYGRKFNVLIFVLTYGLSCVTKHSPNFSILMVGSFLAGIATSILFSAFESWLVSEHNRRGFHPSLMSDTFSKAQFGNAFVAFLAVKLADLVEVFFGKVAPFDTAAAVLLTTGLIVLFQWGENYGDSRQSVGGGLRSAWNMMIADEKILLVGVIQSCFESAMYLMVFSWTPALQSASDSMGFGVIPYDTIFSSFMVCIIIGSSVFVFLMKTQALELFMRSIYVLAVVVFVVTAVSKNVWVGYAALLVFEVICGVYFPAIGTMRAKYVPEVTRSAIMNYFRVPLNVIVCVTLFLNMTNRMVFWLCAVMMVIAAICQQRLFSAAKASIDTREHQTREEQEELMGDGATSAEDATR